MKARRLLLVKCRLCGVSNDHKKARIEMGGLFKAGLEFDSDKRYLVEGIRSGRIKSKRSDGYLVLAGQLYDAIEAGEKRVEYRDFTEYNLKRTIGIKTIRFNRGYGSKGRPPRQMRWEVKKVLFIDDDGRKCDSRRVPDGFSPTTIAVCLGKRI